MPQTVMQNGENGQSNLPRVQAMRGILFVENLKIIQKLMKSHSSLYYHH